MIELVYLNTKEKIENRLFSILEKNNFRNVFKGISILSEFSMCYKIIEEERIVINKIIKNKNLNNNDHINLLKNNKRLIDACHDKKIYLEVIFQNWNLFRNYIY